MWLVDNLKKFLLKKKRQELIQEIENFSQDTQKEEIEKNKENYFIDEKFLYGYILKTLKSIEESLKRIEYNMITKDWASLNLTEKKDLEELINKINEKIEYTKLILPASSALSRSSRSNEIVKKAIEIIKNRKEISYEDLAKELGISNSYLRAIASLIEVNENRIRRIIKDKKGYFIFEEEKIKENSSA